MKHLFLAVAALILIPAMVVHFVVRTGFMVALNFVFFPFRVLAYNANKVARSLRE